MNEIPSTKQSPTIPIAIVFAGLIIAFGIYWSGRGNVSTNMDTKSVPATAKVESIKPIDGNDHILGDPKAKISLVVYSDTECPYCKNFHTTLHQLMNTYGVNGQLSIAYRYFPLHSKSVNEADAQECAAELGGNDAFWKFTDQVFATTNSNDTLDPTQLPKIAGDIGLDVSKFNTCLMSGKYEAKINQEKTDVIASGAEGTPYSIIFVNGEQIPITQGALPYSDMKNIIDTVLSNS